MRIVMLLSQTEITGAEVHAVQLGEWLARNHHEVTIISDTLTIKTNLPYVPRKIHPKGFFRRLGNIFFLRRLIRESKIDVIHAHSRAAVRVAFWARLGTKTALVSTVHGRQHFSHSKRAVNLYGRHIIAVCENIRKHLIADFKLSRHWVQVVRNPLHDETLHFVDPLTTETQMAIVGRTSGPKGDKTKFLILNVFPELLKAFPKLKIHLWGGPLENLGFETIQKMKDLNALYPSCIEHKGSGQLDQVMENYQLIFGAGRVAISSLLRGVPVWALGEAQSEGLVTQENFNRALFSNFGDIGETSTPEELKAEIFLGPLKTFLSSPLPARDARLRLREQALREFSFNQVAKRITSVYEAATLWTHHPRHFPVLMYHLVTREPVDTRHRIFVTRDNFDHQLSLFKKWGFEAITFSDLEEFTTGKKPWSSFPRKPFMITFDDGYQNNLTEALPVLKKHDYKAVIYLLANHSDKDNHWDQGEVPSTPLLTPAERQELFRSGHFEIGSHGRAHKPLTTFSEPEGWTELKESKIFLENEFKTPVLSYAFTYGLNTEELAMKANQTGYKFVVNTDEGGFHLSTPFTSVFRTPIFPQDRGFKLWRKLQSWYRRYFYWTRKK